MANIKDKALYFVGNRLLKYVYKNPQKNMLKLVKLGKACLLYTSDAADD